MTVRRALKTIAIIAAVWVILSAAALYSGALYHDAQWYADYVSDYSSLLTQIARGETDPGTSLRAKWMLSRAAVEGISISGGQTRFHLKSSMLEGHRLLVYAPNGDVPTCLSFYDNWTQVETGDASLRWEGGMNNMACIRLHDLGGGFYLEEAYLPT